MRPARWLALAALLSATVPTAAQAQRAGVALGDPGAPPPAAYVPPPPGYGVSVDAERPPARPRPRRGGYMPTWPLLVPGLAAFVVTYGSSATAGAVLLSDGITEEGTWLLVPIVGPLVLAGQVSDPGGVAMFVALGVAQAAGIALIIAGLALNRRAGQGDDDEASLAPWVSPEGGGAVVRLRM